MSTTFQHMSEFEINYFYLRSFPGGELLLLSSQLSQHRFCKVMCRSTGTKTKQELYIVYHMGVFGGQFGNVSETSTVDNSKVNSKLFHLNGHIGGCTTQTQKLEPPCTA